MNKPPKISQVVLSDTPLARFTWNTNTKAKGVILIVHGMAEHSLRYDQLAKSLNHNGWHVYAHDLRGHGKSSALFQQGDFGANGWKKSLADIDGHRQLIKQQHVDLPLYLLGQGLGAFLLQEYLVAASNDIQGAILTGSNLSQSIPLAILKWIIQIERIRCGGKNTSSVINNLTNKAWNRALPNESIEAAWLSHDPKIQQQYQQDPMCGFPCSTRLWLELIQSNKRMTKTKRQANQIPLFLLSGAQDPIGEYGVGFHRLIAHYAQLGIEDICYVLYPNRRHEILWGDGCETVFQDILSWLDQHR